MRKRVALPALPWGSSWSPSAASASCDEASALAPLSHQDAFQTCELARVLYTPPLPFSE